jgi:hypothetical protein
MLHHHDNRDYDMAASEAAAKARVKMEEMIHRGRRFALATIETVQNAVIHDSIVRGAALEFAHVGAEIIIIRPDKQPAPFHRHGLNQAMERTGIPHSTRFIDTMLSRGEWGAELLAHNLETIYRHGNGARYLLREESGRIKGFLSDKFRRLDSRPLLDAFCGACSEFGILPFDGYALETKFRLRAVLPHIFEPVPNEPQLFGLEWGNSDFGDGVHAVKIWNMRVWCTNTATLDDVLRQVHLGGRLSDDVEYSRRTLELDTQANAAALKDVVRQALSPATVSSYNEAIKLAHEQKIDARDATRLLKAHLNKGEVEAATEAFNSPDVVNLPAGQTVYRLSNAVSWIAQGDGVAPARRLELQEVAGKLLPRAQEVRAVGV